MLLLVGFVIYEASTNAYDNLQRQNIAGGWGFLNNVAGFALSQTLIPYSELSTYGRAFVVGLLNTLMVAAIGIVLATLLGFIVGIARLSQNWLFSKIALCYVEFIRNVPLVLQLMFWYSAVLVPLPGPRDSIRLLDMFFLNNRGLFVPYAVFGENFVFVVAAFLVALAAVITLYLYARRRQEKAGDIIPLTIPALVILVSLPLCAYFVTGGPVTWVFPELRGFNFSGGSRVIPEFVALLLGLVLYTAAFIAEIVRAGIQAVPRGQTEAALALGVSRRKTTSLVVVPQALRIIIPPLTSQYLNLIKNSSLAVAVGYPEFVTVAGTINNQTGQALEVIAITMAVYLFLSLSTSAFMNWYNARIALVER
ncbi:MAG: amino acid ABC transporter permease [Pseudomonadota bacterium]